MLSALQSEHEIIVTRLLSNREILGADGELYDEDYNRIRFKFDSYPIYDLTHFLKNIPPEPSRWGEKYFFVK